MKVATGVSQLLQQYVRQRILFLGNHIMQSCTTTSILPNFNVHPFWKLDVDILMIYFLWYTEKISVHTYFIFPVLQLIYSSLHQPFFSFRMIHHVKHYPLMWTPHKGSLKNLIKHCLLHISIILAAWFTLKSNKLVRHDLYLNKQTNKQNLNKLC